MIFKCAARTFPKSSVQVTPAELHEQLINCNHAAAAMASMKIRIPAMDAVIERGESSLTDESAILCY